MVPPRVAQQVGHEAAEEGTPEKKGGSLLPGFLDKPHRWLASLDNRGRLSLAAVLFLVVCVRFQIGGTWLMPLCIVVAYAYEDRARVLPWLCSVSLETYAKLALGFAGLRFAIYIEFGSVYLMLCVLYLVWDNLGDAEEGSTSAYSVFNADGQQLPGQLTAQDFEREIMHQMY